MIFCGIIFIQQDEVRNNERRGKERDEKEAKEAMEKALNKAQEDIENNSSMMRSRKNYDLEEPLIIKSIKEEEEYERTPSTERLAVICEDKRIEQNSENLKIVSKKSVRINQSPEIMQETKFNKYDSVIQPSIVSSTNRPPI